MTTTINQQQQGARRLPLPPAAACKKSAAQQQRSNSTVNTPPPAHTAPADYCAPVCDTARPAQVRSTRSHPACDGGGLHCGSCRRRRCTGSRLPTGLSTGHCPVRSGGSLYQLLPPLPRVRPGATATVPYPPDGGTASGTAAAVVGQQQEREGGGSLVVAVGDATAGSNRVQRHRPSSIRGRACGGGATRRHPAAGGAPATGAGGCVAGRSRPGVDQSAAAWRRRTRVACSDTATDSRGCFLPGDHHYQPLPTAANRYGSGWTLYQTCTAPVVSAVAPAAAAAVAEHLAANPHSGRAHRRRVFRVRSCRRV